jgi:hypothetical protein
MAYNEERVVHVRDMRHTVSISQMSKTRWAAIGDYMGKRVEVVGTSATNAARRWAAAARLKGNGLDRAGGHSRRR